MIYITIALIALAGIVKALQDLSSEGNLPYKYNKDNTWMNKWKTKLKIDELGSGGCYLIRPRFGNNWWYLGLYKPKYKERFPFSSTVLVAFTDFWHICQFVKLKLLFTAMIFTYSTIVNPFVDFTILYATYTISFEIIHHYIKKKTF